MARKVFHVAPDRDKWAVKAEGSSTALSTHDTKDAAVEAGKTIAKANQPSQLIVHKADGTFDYEHTYGDDPFPPTG